MRSPRGCRWLAVPVTLMVVLLGGPGVRASTPGGGGQGRDPRSDRLHSLELDLVGPMEFVRIPGEGGSRTEFPLELADGERRSLRVPVVSRSGSAGATPEVRIEPEGAGGSCSAVRWGGDGGSGGAFGSWPLGLRIRPFPPVEDPIPKASPGILLLLCVAGTAGLVLRRRPLWVLGVGVLGAGIGIERTGAPDEGSGGLLVYEGEGGAWSRVRVASRRLELGAENPDFVTTRPPEVSLSVSRQAGDEPGSVAEPRWILEGPRGSTLILADRMDGEGMDLGPVESLRTLGPANNTFGDFAETFVREGDGGWSAHGPWALGRPLPPAIPGEAQASPPGAMNPALPLGRRVFLGRRAGDPGGARAVGSRNEGPRETWVRWVGFPP